MSDYQARLSSLQSLPITELTKLTEITTTAKMHTVVVCKMTRG